MGKPSYARAAMAALTPLPQGSGPCRGHAGRDTGAVYLIGAGPGEPDLLTVRGLRLLQCADVVLFDRLVGPEIVDLARPDAVRVYVGKQAGCHPVPQAEINASLRDYAERGLRVARLKGGDPFVFGRGGEEIDSLMQAGIAFQVVPGVSAANGCAAYAGIPLTHRDYAQTVTFVTGHRSAENSLALDFASLVRPGQTLVIYMGLSALAEVTAGLIAHGMQATTPAAVIQQGTTTRQRVVTADLSNLATRVQQANLQPPSLIIIGKVVRLRDRLAWFDTSALSDNTAAAMRG